MTHFPYGRVIGRLGKDKRREVLEACVRAGRRGPVLVEYSWSRKFDEFNRAVVADLLGTAFLPGGSISEVLVIQPPSRRMHAISFAQVMRISLVTLASKDSQGDDWIEDEYGTFYRLGDILAGPPRTH